MKSVVAVLFSCAPCISAMMRSSGKNDARSTLSRAGPPLMDPLMDNGDAFTFEGGTYKVVKVTSIQEATSCPTGYGPLMDQAKCRSLTSHSDAIWGLFPVGCEGTTCQLSPTQLSGGMSWQGVKNNAKNPQGCYQEVRRPASTSENNINAYTGTFAVEEGYYTGSTSTEISRICVATAPPPTESPTPSPTDSPTPAPTDSPTPSPTDSPTDTTVQAIEDPHVTNTLGQTFDLWRLGVVQFLRVPFEASSKNTAEFIMDATIRNVTSDWQTNACLSPYITEVSLSGRSIPRSVVIRVEKPGLPLVLLDGVPFHVGTDRADLGSAFSHPLFLGRPNQHVGVNGKTFNAENALELAVGGAIFQIVAGKMHLNIIADNLHSLGCRIGGLLGEDDHARISEMPSSCANKWAKPAQRAKVFIAVKGNMAFYAN